MQSSNKDIFDSLEQGVKDVFNSERYLNYLTFLSKFHNYSWRNTVLIFMQNPEATLVAGFNDWKNKHKRYVKKGEKAIRIIAPYYKKFQKEVDVLDNNGNAVIVNGKHLTEQKEFEKLLFRAVSVFDVSQTDGEPLPQLTNELQDTVKNYQELFTAISSFSDYPIEFEDISGGAKGYCNYIEQRIAIKNGMSEAQTIKTAIHELTHSRLHNPIDNDKKQNKISRDSAEVQAESVAFVVANHFGIDTSDYSFDYIASWSNGKELEELHESLEIIQKEANIIIQGIEEQYQQLLKDRNIEINNTEKGVDRDMDGIDDSRDSSYTAKIPVPDLLSKQQMYTLEQSFYSSYQGEKMLPILSSQAELFQEYVDIPLYRLYSDGSKALVEKNEKIFDEALYDSGEPKYANGGFFGIEEAAWQTVYKQFIEPQILIEWSESNKLSDGQRLSLAEANDLFKSTDLATAIEYEQQGLKGAYDKTKYALFYTEENTAKIMVDRQDFGDGDGSLINHIKLFNPGLGNYLDCHNDITQLYSTPNINTDRLNSIRNELNTQPMSSETLEKIHSKLIDEVKTAEQQDYKTEQLQKPKQSINPTLNNIENLVSQHKEQITDLPNEHNTVVINAFAGPGAGKTTSCLEVCEKLKKAGYVAEYVQEYAKELVWDNNLELLNGSMENQFTILQEQLKRVDRLYGKVDFIVTDSPILLNTEYLNSSNSEYSSAVQNLYGHFNNFNYFVERDVSKFETEGRIHNLEQSLKIDNSLKNTLQAMNIEFGTYTHNTIDDIIKNAIDYKLHSDYPLNNDLIRHANAATLMDMGDVMFREYSKNLDLISQLNISNKNEAYKTLQNLYNRQLAAQSKSVNPYVSGVARPTAEQNGKSHSELVSKINSEIKAFVSSLQSQSDKNNIADKNKRVLSAISEADKQGLKSITVEGTTYYKARKNWSTTPPKNFKKQEYSKEENARIIADIKQGIPIHEYAQKIGFTVQRVGNYYTLKEHDSVRINPNKNVFTQNSTGVKGSIIDFVMHFENIDKAAAIDKLAKYIGADTKYSLTPIQNSAQQFTDKEKTPLVLPEKAKTMKNIFAYLINTRKIDSQIVNHWVRNGNLYQDTHNNCVFVTVDKYGKANFASQKGTNTSKPFQADVKGSDYNCCHFINNNAKSLIVCEAAIDLMSVQTILKANGRNLNNYNYLSLNGVSKTHAVLNALQSSNTDTVILATDNDKAGEQARTELKELASKFDENIKFIDYVPKNEKDWNAELVSNVQRETNTLSNQKEKLSEKITDCQNKADEHNKMIENNKSQSLAQKRNVPNL